MSIADNINLIHSELPSEVKLVAVSKFHPASAIEEAYGAGQRVFAESRPQEFAAKVACLPGDICWHFIGHLQTNKLKLVLPYADLVQSIDSVHLLDAVQKWAKDNGRIINVLLEYHLGAEQTKGGLSEEEIVAILKSASDYANVHFCGLMGMATNTEDESVIRSDFQRIANLMSNLRVHFPEMVDFRELSIGMSADWKIALEYGATMVRIGSSIFGERQY